jgi:hypothetical protein
MAAGREFDIVWVRDGRGAGAAEPSPADVAVTYRGSPVEIPAPDR